MAGQGGARPAADPRSAVCAGRGQLPVAVNAAQNRG